MHHLIHCKSGLTVLIVVYHSQCKKVQQELCKPGAVEQFIQDPCIAKQIRSTFKEQYSLEMVSLLCMLVTQVYINKHFQRKVVNIFLVKNLGYVLGAQKNGLISL